MKCIEMRWKHTFSWKFRFSQAQTWEENLSPKQGPQKTLLKPSKNVYQRNLYKKSALRKQIPRNWVFSIKHFPTRSLRTNPPQKLPTHKKIFSKNTEEISTNNSFTKTFDQKYQRYFWQQESDKNGFLRKTREPSAKESCHKQTITFKKTTHCFCKKQPPKYTNNLPQKIFTRKVFTAKSFLNKTEKSKNQKTLPEDGHRTLLWEYAFLTKVKTLFKDFRQT